MSIKNIPEVLQYDFLNHYEIIDIKNKVIELKSYWSYVNNNTTKDLNLTTRMLSNGMYSREHFAYMVGVKKLKPIMQKYFGSYYDKIKVKIEQVYNKPVFYLDKANYPGFHIYALDENQTSSAYNSYNFHKDNFVYLKQLTKLGKIVSVIVPISLPKIGGALLYTINEPIHSDLCTDYITFDYKEGMLAQWGGEVTHSIEPFVLNQNEYRITLQMHLNVNDDKIDIFW